MHEKRGRMGRKEAARERRKPQKGAEGRRNEKETAKAIETARARRKPQGRERDRKGNADRNRKDENDSTSPRVLKGRRHEA